MKTILVDAGGTFLLKGIGIDQEMYKLLEDYTNPKILLSNADDEQIAAYGFTNLPYPLFTLKHNPDKENSEYFVKLLNQYKLRVEDVVYFDHINEAVMSAQSLGIKALFYDSEKRDLNALKEFLETNL